MPITKSVMYALSVALLNHQMAMLVKTTALIAVLISTLLYGLHPAW
jgi:hypothetical protein